MITARKDQLEQAIQKLDRFRRFFRRLPEKSINLNNILCNRRGDSVSFVDPPCGAVGCILGWLKVWEHKHPEDGVGYLGQYLLEGPLSNLFNSRMTKKPQKVEALERLAIHRKRLVEALKEEMFHVEQKDNHE